MRVLKNGTVLIDGRPITPWKCPQGLAFAHNGRRHYVHRLVAERYVPNPRHLRYVEFKDGDKYNPSADNLAWTRSNHGKLGRDAAQAIRASTARGVTLAREYGVSEALISRVRGGKRWS